MITLKEGSAFVLDKRPVSSWMGWYPGHRPWYHALARLLGLRGADHERANMQE